MEPPRIASRQLRVARWRNCVRSHKQIFQGETNDHSYPQINHVHPAFGIAEQSCRGRAAAHSRCVGRRFRNDQAAQANLVQIVREATAQFADVNAAIAAGYEPAFGCVTGPDMGAMGVHYINGDLVSGGQLNPQEPQALIYEPVGKAMKLVGVEFIAIADPWLAAHQQAPPVLEGQLLQYIGTPNRYALPGLFELHVWAWRDNPHGAYVDWNTHVSCENK